jgi:hypothetical protein
MKIAIIVGVFALVIAGFVMSALAEPPRRHEACHGQGCNWCGYTGRL